MKIQNVTITGADDLTDPEQLCAISAAYPCVEWGILLSGHSKPRFPSLPWIERLAGLASPSLRCALHLCGRPLKDVWQGEAVAELERPLFQRIQLNLSHVSCEAIDLPALAAVLPRGKEIIVQVGTAVANGLTIASALHSHGHQVALLFDCSGGRGLTPEQWPAPVDAFRCGFAGGLNPENLDRQLRALSACVGDRSIWIDMESGVRTDNRLDLVKVRACLDQIVDHRG